MQYQALYTHTHIIAMAFSSNFYVLHYFVFTDDMERTTTVEAQDATAEDPPTARESEEEEAQSQRSPSPSEDVQQEEAGAQGQQQKEEESN